MRPSQRLLYLFVALTVGGLVTVIWPQALMPWIWLAALASIVALLDALRLQRGGVPEVTRRLTRSLALGKNRDVDIELINEHGQAIVADVYDHHPPTFVVEGLPRRVRIEPHAFTRFKYRMHPTERGIHHFQSVELRLYSPLALWTRRVLVEAPASVDVFPNFAAVTKYAILGTDSQISAGSLHRRPRRGEGLEFHQLREYRVGDTFRQIDWKATARTGKLVAKEYQEERDQQVVFMLDTGRRMLAKEGELSHFDHVLNALLLLSYVALRQGDAVGFLTCGAEPQWMKPRKGLTAVNVLANRLFDLKPQPVAVDYQAAATQLALRQKRRALVIMMTNIRDEDSDDLEVALRLLRRRHLVMIASLRESAIDARFEEEIVEFGDALRFASTHHHLESRRATHETLASKGVLVQDTTCDELPAAITNRYLEIKRAGML